MMTDELKTLKDIEFGRTEKEDRKFLRAEAIKWVKEIRSEWLRLHTLKTELDGKEAQEYVGAR